MKSKPIKILTVVGARPQFIKAAVVSREIKQDTNIQEVIVHTGQHFDENMSDVFFKQMEIPMPDYNLSINSMSHGAMTGKMLEKVEEVLILEKPDWVLVYGDTNSTIAGALAAKKLHIKVAHVEAGLRSYNMKMPEEINRILTDRISDVLFCPTDTAVNNLIKEGYNNIDCKIIKSGDVMQDAAMFYSSISKKPDFNIPPQFILSTIHRAENTDDKSRLENIFSAFNELSQTIPVVLPLHPRTKKKLDEHNLNDLCKNLTVISSVGYLEMVFLLQNCTSVMTDSGGLQKEAFFFKKPCITLREETEWVELVKHGFNILVGSDINKIKEAVFNQKTSLDYSVELYGQGNAGKKIVESLVNNM